MITFDPLVRPLARGDQRFIKEMKRAKKLAQRSAAELNAQGVVAPSQTSQPNPRSFSPVRPSETPTIANLPDPVALVDFEALEFDNAYEFHKFFWPEQELYGWQREVLLQCSGFTNGRLEGAPLVPTDKNPLIYSLVAANGSGKSKMILARLACFYAACNIRHKTIVTSASFSQLKHMTFAAIADAIFDINRVMGFELFSLVECYAKCNKSGSIIRGFATDQPGRAEGEHPNYNCGMAVLVDEAKSIDDSMFHAFSRFTGFNVWLEVSSPGACEGHFYRKVMAAEDRYPAPLQLGRSFTRTITAFDNPHISQAHINTMRKMEGETSIIYRSSILAEFTSIDDLAIIKQESTIYTDPPHRFLHLPKVAGLDIALGGDETILSIWHGNKRIAQEVWRIKEEPFLHAILIESFIKHGLLAENINGDGGGIGKPIIQRIRDAGWDINSVRNESAASNKKEYLNRGIENMMKLKRLVEEKILILPREDAMFMNQLVTRRYAYSNGKLKAESKADAKARGVASPDRFDAAVLAFVHLPIDVFLGESFEEPVERPITPEILDRIVDAERAREPLSRSSQERLGMTTAVQSCARTGSFTQHLRSRGYSKYKL
jgi:hypothetical protein